ncbi:hypothetical protein BS17DRAFT_371946 [Gyrodon lividus]|nr:hypothetical protein BS17DRAFT_371946 [Gyrodon lividus]
MLKSDDMLERSRACSALPSLVKDTLTRGKLLNEQTLKTVTGSCRVTADDRIKLQSVQCLALLATHDGVPALIVDAGAVGDIRELLEDPHKLVVVAALKILTKLATDASAYSVLADTLPLPPMIRHAGNYDEHLTPAAVTAILALAQSGSATLRRQVEIARGSLLSIFEGIAQQTKSMTLRQVGRDAKRILDELLPPVNR